MARGSFWSSRKIVTQSLPSAAWARLERVLERFEDAWQSGQRPNLDAYLAEAGPGERLVLLIELVHEDLDYRLRAGEAARIDAYLARYSELGADPEVAVNLITAEYALRRQHEPALSPEDYRGRFPEYAETLAARLAAAAPAQGPNPSASESAGIPCPAAPDAATRPGTDMQSQAPGVPGYEILGELGHGGMGVVYRARHLPLQRLVALKLLRAEYRGLSELERRFLEEAQLTGQLQHPGIPPVHEVGVLADGRPFLAMKLIQGHTLADLLRERPSPAGDLPRFLDIFEQVCQTMAYAHARAVIHRDLKPANIMVGAFGEVQVMDWGLAKVLRKVEADKEQEQCAESPAGDSSLFPHPSSLPKTRAGTVLGTPAYMGPEQARGEIGSVDRRADVFGLGAILCEILTGQPPYLGDSGRDVQCRAARGDVEEAQARLAACGADAELLDLARACLAAAPESRPPDAGVVAGAMVAYQAAVKERLGRAERERAAAEVQAAEERKRRRLTAALAGVVLVLLALGCGGAWAIHQQRVAGELEQARQAAEKARQERDLAVGVEADLHEFEQRLNRASAVPLDDAPARKELLAEALTALERAQGRLSHGGDEQLGTRVRRARAELDALSRDQEMLARLDNALLQASQARATDGEPGGAARLYREAFAWYGLPAVRLDLKEASERVRASALRERLVAALDDWALLHGGVRAPAEQAGEADWLRDVANGADGSAWRRRLREALGKRDAETIQNSAEEAAAGELPLADAVLVADALHAVGKMDAAIDVLSRARQAHPGDFRVNVQLALFCYHAHPARLDDAVRFHTACVALRPLSPIAHSNLGSALSAQGKHREAGAEFTEAVRLKPDFPEARYNLGNALERQNQLPRAVAEYRQAVRLKPEWPAAHNNLGVALKRQGQFDQAAVWFREALRLKPNFVQARINLGGVLRLQNRPADAVNEFHNVLLVRPRDALAHNGLANALADLGKLPEAVAEYRQALVLRPDFAEALHNLGVALVQQGELPAAVAEFEKALRLEPDDALTHYNLGLALRCQGKFAESLTAIRRAHELGSKNPSWRHPSGRWVRKAERYLELDERLPAIFEGEVRPRDAAERIALAELCHCKQRYADAARFYVEAFAEQSDLADEVRSGTRYGAACAAALAGCGRGQDAERLNEPERARWRQRARDWLGADLAWWRQALKEASPQLEAEVQQQMRHWQSDPDLAGVRDPAAVAKLPEAERARWQQLWADVAALLEQAQKPFGEAKGGPHGLDKP
jgi:serine/threonine-protein kinase